MDKVGKQITKMLKESTGEAMCDSGGTDNRHWQKNQSRDFTKEKPICFDIFGDQITFQLNVYHYLNERLNITKESEALQKAYENFVKDSGDSYLGDMEEFAENFGTNICTENTYNGESCLSQVLQFTCFSLKEKDFVILQIHNGCDVRGGYTKPYIFECSLEDLLCGQNDASISCPDGHTVYTDDGYHWYGNEVEGNVEVELNGSIKETKDGEIGIIACPACGKEIVVDLKF